MYFRVLSITIFCLIADVCRPVPVRIVLTQPTAASFSFMGDLQDGWRGTWADRMFSSVELVAIDDAFACASNQGSLEGKLLFVREGNCALTQKELVAQTINAGAIIVWNPTADYVPPVKLQQRTSNNILNPSAPATPPIIGIERITGATLRDLLTFGSVVRLLFPTIEPGECPDKLQPKIVSVSRPTASELHITALLRASQLQTCWFLASNDGCLLSSSSSTCKAQRNVAVQLSANQIRCAIPIAAQREPDKFRIGLQLSFTSGNISTLTCFSHGHSQTSFTDPMKLAPIPPSIVPNSSLTDQPALCKCVESPVPCSVRISNSRSLHCQTMNSCPQSLATYASAGNEIEYIAPCDGTVPGIPSLTCSTFCLGIGCTRDDQCVCDARFSGLACDIPVCDPICDSEHGVCIAPNTCACAEGYYGVSCDDPICTQNCSQQGVCFRPNDCRCFSGFDGEFCEVQMIDSQKGTQHYQIAIAIVVSGLVVAILCIILLWKMKKSRPLVITQPPPEGVELGPIVSRVTTVENKWFCWTRSQKHTEEFFENESEDIINRQLGLLPTYRDSLRESSFSSLIPSQTEASSALENDEEAPPSYASLRSSQLHAFETSLRTLERRISGPAMPNVTSANHLPAPTPRAEQACQSITRRPLPRGRSNNRIAPAPPTQLPSLQLQARRMVDPFRPPGATGSQIRTLTTQDRRRGRSVAARSSRQIHRNASGRRSSLSRSAGLDFSSSNSSSDDERSMRAVSRRQIRESRVRTTNIRPSTDSENVDV